MERNDTIYEEAFTVFDVSRGKEYLDTEVHVKGN